MKLKYVDIRPIFFPSLKKHPGGVILPNGDNIIEVTDGEAKHLLKQMNGKKPCYVVIDDKPKSKSIEDEV